MRKILASIVTGTVLSLGLVTVTTAPTAQAAQVHKPKAKPGQFCAKRYHNDWTRTARYGKLKCVRYHGGSWHWKHT